MALIIRADGTGEELTPDGDNGTCTLGQLQRAVGGYIEIVGIPGGTIQEMVVNEEGLLIGLPINALASIIACRTIVGDVVLCTSHEAGADDVD